MSNMFSFIVRGAGLLVGFTALLALAFPSEQTALAQGPTTAPAGTAKNPGSGGTVPDQTSQSAQGGSTLYGDAASYQQSKINPKYKRTIKAHVVALDQPYLWNRLGASQPNAMIYALARDVVPTDYDPKIDPSTLNESTTKTFTPPDISTYKPGCVRLREDRRPRPLVLRANEGDLLEVRFTNLLAPAPSPTSSVPVVTRYAGFHVMGLELFRDGGIGNDSSWVGTNPAVNSLTPQPGSRAPRLDPGGEPGSICAPGETKVYKYYARAEGTYLVHSFSADAPGSQNSQLQSGLFAVVNVQPEGGEYYRSQVIGGDLDLATFYSDQDTEKKLNLVNRDVKKEATKESKIATARETPVYLPEQAGVYALDPAVPARTNMHLIVEIDEKTAQPRMVPLNGKMYQAYTLKTVVPSPPDDRIKRTIKTTSVILIDRPGDELNRKRLFLDNGQQLVNYLAVYDRAARYPSGQPIPAETPVLSMLKPAPFPVRAMDSPALDVVYGDLTGIITGPNHDRWSYSSTGPMFRENPSSPDRRQPYREFTIVYHYNFQSVPAFPQVGTNGYGATGGDFFAINYGCAGIGAEILANRLEVGPMGNKDAVDLKFEEFFLSSWSCGDPAMVVNVPANAPNQAVTTDGGLKIKTAFSGISAPPAIVKLLDSGTLPLTVIAAFQGSKTPITPSNPTLVTRGARWTVTDGARNIYTIMLEDCKGTPTLVATFPAPPPQQALAKFKATKAYYPDDPSNVYHSYMRDHVKFRVLNASENVTHVHHQHAHQWLRSPNSDNSQYLDSQTIVAGSGYTMEISHGGSGNRNYTVGDSIFHCHFYPHFAEGMWSLWRVHDVFEAGTKLDKDGIPDANEYWNRVLPDGEIATGTPIPAIVPMPSLAMAPPPARVRLVDHGRDRGRRVIVEAKNQWWINLWNALSSIKGLSSIRAFAPVPNYQINPGYPFFIPAIAGHRPPHPPMDFAWKEDEHGDPARDPRTDKIIYLDGGLPRHQVINGEIVRNFFTPWDFTKDFVVFDVDHPNTVIAGGLEAYELPQLGTAVERAAMKAHSTRSRFAYMPNGDPANFILNGLPPVPGAPFAPPDVRADGSSSVNVRRYKAAVLQLDTVLNKKGWHFPQQRLLTLWHDVAPTVSGVRPPQPFFFRSNTDDTIEYWHTNLVPNYYEMDDFQVRTPTDVLGQHIHLVKFDVTSSDGAGNGFNYEDGTFSPQEVRERIAAINAKKGIFEFDERIPFEGRGQHELEVHSVIKDYRPGPNDDPKWSLFGAPPPGQIWDGAQTTIQRFDTDPTLNTDGLDRTVRSVFTHDHFSPSTHQQAGYYAALLVEPADSTWEIPEITIDASNKPTVQYVPGGKRDDGGPTSWQANILTVDPDQSYREFALEFQDMQLAYLANSPLELRKPSELKPPREVFTLNGPAKQALAGVKRTGTVPAAVAANLATNGIILADNATVSPPTSTTHYIIIDKKEVTGPPKKVGGPLSTHEIISHYLIDAISYSLFAPDAPPGWSDPLNAVAALGSKKKPVLTPQLISFGTVGTYSVNYRNEPLPPRVHSSVIGKPESTDLAFAYASIERGDPDLNVQPRSFAMDPALEKFLRVSGPVAAQLVDEFEKAGATLPSDAQVTVDTNVPNPVTIGSKGPGIAGPTYAIRDLSVNGERKLYVFTVIPGSDRVFPPPIVPLSADANANDGGVAGPDPFTPLLRAYANDRVQVRALAGAHMNEHSFLIHGVKYFFEPSYTNSGFQTTQAISLSEHFEMEFTVPAQTATQGGNFADFLYAPSASAQGQTSGSWGILRAYDGSAYGLDNSGPKYGPADSKSSTYLKPLKSNETGNAPATLNFGNLYSAAPANQKREYTVIATTAQQILGNLDTPASRASPNGTLYYNTRGQATGNYPFQAKDAAGTRLENPYALLYVNADDLGPDGKLRADSRVEPPILRANAGDWIKINLINQFNSSDNTFSTDSIKDVQIGIFPAGNPFIRLRNTHPNDVYYNYDLSTSQSVGLHPQLVAYDITAADGMNVGFNPPATIGPGESQSFYWYAGTLSFDESKSLVQTPVEFGSVNLAPADPLIQHRKGLIGALVVEPKGSTWPRHHVELENSTEYQYIYNTDGTVAKIDKLQKKTRAVATVTKEDGSVFREIVLVMQTDAYMYQNPKAGSPKPTQPVLTNASALNYRTEPLVYRYDDGSVTKGLVSSFPWGTAARLSNGLVSPNKLTQPPNYPAIYADPQTPVVTVKAGTPVRFRWIYPAGAGGDAGGSSQVPTVNGHVFQEEPYINDSEELGLNPLSEWTGGRFIVPGQTVDMLFPYAGGSFQVPGDYFYGTFIGQTTTAAKGVAQATWGLLRVTP